ncbi:MAG TPA: hypothetical protein VK919_12225 [Solirubrobacterales bacterium]|nr:hypothetical protein [Solirubrobacterales bacterium]
MTKKGETKRYTKAELVQMLHAADLRMQVLETALRQIADQASDDPKTLQRIAGTALQKADEARSAV